MNAEHTNDDKYEEQTEGTYAQDDIPGSDQVPFVGKLHLNFGNEDEKTISIKDGKKVTIGRAGWAATDKPTINLTQTGASQAGVSRKHAAIQREGDTLLLIDLDSTNGTYLNHERIQPNQPFQLQNGDVIRLGLYDVWISFL